MPFQLQGSQDSQACHKELEGEGAGGRQHVLPREARAWQRVRAELHENPVGWDRVYPHTSEAMQDLFLPPSLSQKACKLSERGSHLLHRSFSRILLFFPSVSHLAHPLTFQHPSWRWIYSPGGEGELDRLQMHSPRASGPVICWLFRIWWQNSSWATNTYRKPCQLPLVSHTIPGTLLPFYKRLRKLQLFPVFTFPHTSRSSFPWQ